LKKSHTNFLFNKTPIVGVLLFILLFLYAAQLYPGGSQANLDSVGFDWVNNYWCNLLNEKAINGKINPARPYSISATIILCSSLMAFFIQFANVYASSKQTKSAIKSGGILAMLFAMMIFTKYHDLMTIISSFFGIFALMGIVIEIYKSDLINYKISGLCCLLLLGVNNFIYYTQLGITYLPLIQKISLFIILLWILGLNQTIGMKMKD